MTFNDFNFDDRLMDGLSSMNYARPTPIQEQAIPVILSKKDLIGCAQTGTGKTAAYLLPIIHNIIRTEKRHLNTLVIAPTRELVQQIDQQVEGFAYYTGVSSIPIYGGGDGATWEQQKRALKEGVDIIIATPGRLIAQLASGEMDLGHVHHLVLDEADRMLDMGFYDDIIKIISYLPKKRQTLLFSATMPPKIRALAGRILHQPEEISIAISKPAEGILQEAYFAFDSQKVPLLRQLLSEHAYASILIFASTKENVKKLYATLHRAHLQVKAIHSDLEQPERESILREFKNKQLSVLIGTDVLSRGIDVDGISLVINFDVPPDPEDYIHRIGRTARAETTGTAITFVNEKDQRKFLRIEKLIGREITKKPLPPALGAGPSASPESKPKKDFSRKRWHGRKNRPGKGRPH